MDDAGFLREAVELARESLTDDAGGPFGAIIVLDGRIVGRGRNRVLAQRDPTAHAEIVAIRDACDRLRTHELGRTTAYTSSEPCPMCLGALYWARVDRIVYAVDRQGAARAGFDDAFFYDDMCRDPADRHVRTEHLPMEEALAVIQAWRRRPDRQGY